MSVDLGRSTIFKEFEALRHRWIDTEAIWKDTVRLEFEKEKWIPMEQAVLTCLGALDRIAPVLIQIRDECSSNSGGYF